MDEYTFQSFYPQQSSACLPTSPRVLKDQLFLMPRFKLSGSLWLWYFNLPPLWITTWTKIPSADLTRSSNELLPVHVCWPQDFAQKPNLSHSKVGWLVKGDFWQLDTQTALTVQLLLTQPAFDSFAAPFLGYYNHYPCIPTVGPACFVCLIFRSYPVSVPIINKFFICR